MCEENAMCLGRSSLCPRMITFLQSSLTLNFSCCIRMGSSISRGSKAARTRSYVTPWNLPLKHLFLKGGDHFAGGYQGNREQRISQVVPSTQEILVQS